MSKQPNIPSPVGHRNRIRRTVRRGFDMAMRAGLSRKPDPKTTPPLFVIGSGRSGNTLVRRVVLASEQMYIPPETYVMGDIIENWPRTTGLTWQQRVWLFCAHFERHPHFETFGVSNLNDFANAAARWGKADRHLRALFNGFYQFLSQHAGCETTRWGEKSPWNVYHLPGIGYHYPNAHYLWLLRDGRDAALSYAEAGLYPDLETSAVRWADANRLCAAFAKQKFNVRIQRYEDLVRDPESQFKALFDWADLRFAPEMLTKQAGPMGDVEKLEHHANVVRPISASSVGRWKAKLSSADLKALPDVFHTQLRAFEYAD